MITRKPCVAGRFYPAGTDELKSELKQYLKANSPEKALAVIVPHAGYVYSGAVAGAVFARTVIPDDVILIGPNHTGAGSPVSVMAEGEWETPLGKVPVNTKLARLILDGDDSNGAFTEDNTAHLGEHSLEVQLPFIQTLNPRASIVPITVMSAGPEECALMGAAIAGAIKAWKGDVLIVISSDMNHYEEELKTRTKDGYAIEQIKALSPDGLLDVTSRLGISMCGAVPAAIGMNAAIALGATEARVVRYATSATASGDFFEVVGYAGIAIR